jgi:quercetin dioxygenase-like cupin family protein
MRINDDLTKPVLVDAGAMNWVPSPAAGVDRRMLYREGAEVARATSIVRYAAGSSFPPHVHSGGEEILVLSGTFQDEHGDYPAGSYFRNPPGTSHSPAAAEGCEIFVRLWQFRLGDAAQIVRQPGQGETLPERDGATHARLLFDDGAERVVIEAWQAGGTMTVQNRRGLEFLVVAGNLSISGTALAAQGWGRLPAGHDLAAKAGPEGATVWIKDAPLQHADILKMPA